MKKLQGIDKISIVYMGKLQEFQDALTYAINKKQTINVWVFTDNHKVLQALQDPNKYSAL